MSTYYYGDFYYVGLTNDCLHSAAQFRYRDNGAFFNIFRDGCIVYVYVRGIWVFQVWDGRPDNRGACLNVFRPNSAGSLVFGSKCAVPKEPGGTTRTKNFIEGDHIQLVNYCNRKEQQFLFGKL